jgi:hypothetical protein
MRIHTILIAQSIVALLQAAGAATVTVDFSVDKGVMDYRASGHLHSISATAPTAQYVEPLKPKLWRTNERLCTKAAYDRMVAAGCTIQIVFSDSKTPTTNDWPGWETWVAATVNKHRAAGMTNLQYDVWNEAGGGFFDAFLHTVKAVKAIDPNILISAPSFATYPGIGFLQQCEAAKVYPDILTWHANWEDYVIEDQIKEMVAYIKLKNLPIKRIQINEYLRDTQMYDPKWHLWNLAELDRSEMVTGAALACWPDAGNNNCWDYTLNGLMNHSQQPRASWFVQKAYADITGRRAGITPAGVRLLDGIMGFDAQKHELRGVFSPINSAGTSTVALRNLSSTGFLSQSGSVNVTVQKIVPSGSNSSTGFTAVSSQSMHYTNNQLDITVSVPSDNVFTVVVSAAPSRAQSESGAYRNAGSIHINAGSVNVASAGHNTVSIISIQGKLLSRTAANGPQAISLDHVMPGTCLMKAETAEGTMISRIVKDR